MSLTRGLLLAEMRQIKALSLAALLDNDLTSENKHFLSLTQISDINFVLNSMGAVLSKIQYPSSLFTRINAHG